MRNTFQLVPLLFILAISISSPAYGIDANSAEPDSMEEQVVAETNKAREAQGLSALQPDPSLMDAARIHAADMAKHGFLSHSGSDGSTPQERMEEAGYINWRSTGENVAAGQDTAEGVVASWMKSPPHRANILNPDFCDIGVGVASTSNGAYGTYWAAKFGCRQ